MRGASQLPAMVCMVEMASTRLGLAAHRAEGLGDVGQGPGDGWCQRSAALGEPDAAGLADEQGAPLKASSCLI